MNLLPEKYSKELLDDIMLDAMHGLSLIEIALRLNIPYTELYEDYCNPELFVKQYYDSGVIRGKTETDDVLYKLAKNGSVAAKINYDKKLQIAHLTNIFKEIDES